MKTNIDAVAVLRDALDIALDLANAEAASLKESLGERLPHKHAAAARDVQTVKDAIAALATERAATQLAGEAVYQIANDNIPSGWSDVDRNSYDMWTTTMYRKKRMLYAAPISEGTAPGVVGDLAAECIKAISIGYTDMDHLDETLKCSDCGCNHDAGEDHDPGCLVIRAREYLATQQDAKAEQVCDRSASCMCDECWKPMDAALEAKSEASADEDNSETRSYQIAAKLRKRGIAPTAPSGSIGELSTRLRDMVQKLRRTPQPIADVVPMLQQAADEIDRLAARTPAIVGGIAEDMKLRDLMAEFHAQPQNSYEEEAAENAVYAYLDTIIKGGGK